MRKAFTLIEALVIIAIVAILFAVLFGGIQQMRRPNAVNPNTPGVERIQ